MDDFPSHLLMTHQVKTGIRNALSVHQEDLSNLERTDIPQDCSTFLPASRYHFCVDCGVINNDTHCSCGERMFIVEESYLTCQCGLQMTLNSELIQAECECGISLTQPLTLVEPQFAEYLGRQLYQGLCTDCMQFSSGTECTTCGEDLVCASYPKKAVVCDMCDRLLDPHPHDPGHLRCRSCQTSIHIPTFNISNPHPSGYKPYLEHTEHGYCVRCKVFRHGYLTNCDVCETELDSVAFTYVDMICDCGVDLRPTYNLQEPTCWSCGESRKLKYRLTRPKFKARPKLKNQSLIVCRCNRQVLVPSHKAPYLGSCGKCGDQRVPSGQMLADVLTKFEITNDDLARTCDLTLPYIVSVLEGSKPISKSFSKKIGKLLDMDPEAWHTISEING